MSGDAALVVQAVGMHGASVPERPAAAWLTESRSLIALLATRDTYAAQPSLWKLGEHGRARTIEDFEHHLHAALGTDVQWRAHLAYCVELFAARGFPFRWLIDAFATLSAVLVAHLPEQLTADVRARLADGPAIVQQLASERGVDPARPTAYDD